MKVALFAIITLGLTKIICYTKENTITLEPEVAMADEKGDEKEAEKREEKSPQEKSVEEKYRRDPLGTVVWAAILIWAGIVLLLNNMQVLDNLKNRFTGQITGPVLNQVATVGALIAIGAGVIILLEILIRLIVPAYRRSVTGSLIFAVILICVGLGPLVKWDYIWPVILIVIGASILLRGLFRRSGSAN